MQYRMALIRGIKMANKNLAQNIYKIACIGLAQANKGQLFAPSKAEAMANINNSRALLAKYK